MSHTSRSRPKQPLHRRTETFIVRVWTEYLEQIPPAWRGEIEHVGSKQAAHFRNIDKMVEFMKRRTADKPVKE